MAGNAVESGRTVASKVTAILMAFADGADWSLSELARLTTIPHPGGPLAFAPARTARAVVACGLPRYTPCTLTRASDLLHALSVARLTRIATCDGELAAGECTVAAPVTGPGGRVLAALEIRVPDLRGLDATRQLLTVTARSLSRELAGPGAAPAMGAAVGAAS